MRIVASLMLLASLASACTAHRAPTTAPRAEPRYVVGLLPLRASTPEAAEEAKAHDARLAATLKGLVPGTPVEVVHPPVSSPANLDEARERATAAGVNTLVWGDVALEGGKLTVKLSGFETTLGAPSGFWPMEYTLAAPQVRAQLDLDALRLGQAILQETLLPMMMRDQPANVRAVLEALVVKAPKDWVEWNRDIIARRWGMLGRLTRDGALTEKGYRGALADVAAWHANNPPTPGTNAKEAFYSVGLARGFLLQGRPQAAVDVLVPIVERMPGDAESRLVLGRAYLALGDTAAAAAVLEPLAREANNTPATRLYVAAVTRQPGGETRANEALTRLVEKNPEDTMARLVRYLAAPQAGAEELKAFTAAHAAGDWPLPVARFLAGELGEAALWEAAKDEDSHMERIRRIQAHYYLGEAALAGRLPRREGTPDREEARQHFEAAIGTHAFHHPAYDLADALLEQLQRDVR